jgi:hypothetical protein
MAEFPLEFLLQVKNEMSAGLTQATSQLKSMGSEAASSASKVKASGLGIGASISLVTTQLVSTANSIINLKRQWEDLTRAQNNVKQSGYTLASAKGNLENAVIKLGKAQAGTAGASENEIKIAKLQFKEDMKNAKSKLDVMKAHEKLNKVLNQGGKDAGKITIATNNLERAKRRVASASINEKEAQQNLKRAYEDFYLQTIPTAIGIFGSFATMIATFQTSGGLSGIATSLLKFSPILIGVGAAFAAVATNFLGFRTFLENLGRDIGNAVPALKPFLELIEALGSALGLTDKDINLNKALQNFTKGLQPIIDGFKTFIDTIMKGDWNKLFTMLKRAALEAWHYIKQNVPFFGDIESLVNKLKSGNWKGALLQIWVAAVSVWKTIKEAFPIFGDIENIVNDIKAGKWGEAFQKIVDVAKEIFKNTFGKGIAFLLGDNWQLGLEAFLKLQEAEAVAHKRPLVLQYAITINSTITAWTGIDVMKWFTDHPITGAIPFFGGITMMVDDPKFRGSVALGSTIIINALGAAIVRVAQLLDPYIADMIGKIDFSGKDVLKALTDAGQKLWDGLFKSIGDAANKADWGKLITDAILHIGGSETANKIGGGLAETPMGQLLGLDKFKNPVIIKAEMDKNNKSLIDKWVENTKKPITVKIQSNIVGPDPRAEMQKSINNLRGHAVVGRAAGFHGIVTGPTMFTAGERVAEQVDITTRADMMTQRKEGGTGTITVVVPVMLNGKQIAEAVASEISVNQVVYR